MQDLLLKNQNLAINTDLYQLTMMAGYFECGKNPLSTFEFFVREFPLNRSFLVVSGLEQVIHYLKNLKFAKEDIEYIKSLPQFSNISQEFFDYLHNFNFSGDLWAVPEGTIMFPKEPILRVTAPLIEAQLIETYLLSVLNFEITVASKAARICLAADDKKVFDFGSRKAHGPQAAIYAARASYIGGCSGTSNVLASKMMKIPVIGTCSHSWIMSFKEEKKSFEAYVNIFPENTILLVDTYDTIEGVENAIASCKKLQGIRLDSGNLGDLAKKARIILDKAGYKDTKIVASSDLNEYKIEELIKDEAPIDYFGVGTEMVTSRDDPALCGVYKLVEQKIDNRWMPKSKKSKKKFNYPGGKQVYRFENSGNYIKDKVCYFEEIEKEGEALLLHVVKKGELLYKLPEIEEIRDKAKTQLEKFPKDIKCLIPKEDYKIEFSKKLGELRV